MPFAGFILLLALLAPQAPAPAPPRAKRSARADQARQKELARWRERAQLWTTRALAGEDALEPAERPLLRARLGELWWKLDPPRARAFLEEAIAEAEKAPQNESVEAAKARLELAGRLIQITTGLDSSYRRRVLRIALRILDAFPGDRQLRMNVMARLADLSAGAEPDPEFDLEVARVLIRHDSGNYFQLAWQRVARKDPATAAQLYDEALRQARQSLDNELIFGLAELAYPRSTLPDFVPKLPEAQRQDFLNLLAEAITRPAASAEEHDRICGLFLNGARLQKYLAPAQLARVQAVASTCTGTSMKHVTAGLKAAEKQLETPEDYLRAAGEESDPEVSRQLRFTAARVAADGEHPERALEILDAMSAEEKESDEWQSEWYGHAWTAIQPLLDRKEMAALEALLDHTPRPLAAMLLIQASYFASRADQPSLASSFYLRAARALEQYGSPDPRSYTSLVALAALLAPADVPMTLQVAVKGLNENRPPKAGGRRFSRVGYTFGTTGLPPTLADYDDAFLQAVADDLQSPHDRVAFRVSYLRMILGRYQQLAAPSAQAPPRRPK